MPSRALGAGVDGHEQGDIAKIYTPANVAAMRSAGLRPLTYRLRTELGVEAWHWNPRGRWSDMAHRQGYWTSDSSSSASIQACYGYRLPRRGSTIDQANNDGYSRIDDGDSNSFWKSNPYLDHHYTGEDNSLHPQWLVIDLGKSRPINAVRVDWGVPYATAYAIEFWRGADAIYINENAPGRWERFPAGAVDHGRGGGPLIRLAERAVKARFVRVVMTAASGSVPAGSKDVRDRLGYAVREVFLGTIDGAGRFHDILRHGRTNKTQTIVYASSTDPWHRSSDLDSNVEQPGFDRVFRSGLTSGLPCMIPVGMLYDNPDNALAELRFLSGRGYKFTRVEMGEEPDGQYVVPEDYAALYIRWARAIHAAYPDLRLGGPCFQTTVTDVAAWPDRRGDRSWMRRFLDYLQARGASKEYAFFSFEWYPFDNVCAATAPQLARAPEILAGVLERLQRDGLSRDIPWYITEYGYSAFAGQAEVDIPGALLNADIVGQFLTLGGSAAYLYGYEPNTLIKESTRCDTWGNLALFLSDDDRHIRSPLPAYYAARLCSQEWALPGDGRHDLYRCDSTVVDKNGRSLVTAYAVHRPDSRWALMLINKDPKHAQRIVIDFAASRSATIRHLTGAIDIFSYSSRQFVWKPDGERGHPTRSLPPEYRVLPAPPPAGLELPPYSLTIVRGHAAS